MDKNRFYRMIPKVDVLLEEGDIKQLILEFGRATVLDAVRRNTHEMREVIAEENTQDRFMEKLSGLRSRIAKDVKRSYAFHLKRVINATGTILHTNLGRAPISPHHADRLRELAAGYTSLEYDLERGGRGERCSHFEELLCKVTGAEAAIAVNNNAAAVLLVLSTLAKEKEVIVSRGELVEIGGNFRIPDVIEQGGAVLVEAGTTNKTHLFDYKQAVSDNTGVLLKVHTSNYKIIGFTESVSLKELAALGAIYQIPVVEDLGSGVLIGLESFGCGHEPTVQESIASGADVVCFSGDKLLGGPQAGIILGKRKYIEQMKKHPLIRAFRIDKFSAAVLEMTVQEYLDTERAIRNIPVLAMLSRTPELLHKDADELLELFLKEELEEEAQFSESTCTSRAGGGSLPAMQLKSSCVAIRPLLISTEQLEKKLRLSEVPVIGRIYENQFIMDLRTIAKSDYELLVQEVKACLKEGE